MDQDEMISVIRSGLPKTGRSRKIIVVGAGMSGLVTASLLKEAGHEVTILEARDRVGGRVYTIRSPFSDGLYFDAGAMRIPRKHRLVLTYIEKFGLKVNPFLNIRPNDLIYVNGVKTRLKTYRQHPDLLHFPVAPSEKGKTDLEMLGSAVQPIIEFARQNPRNWDSVVRIFGKYSMEDFLRFNPFGVSLSPGAIDMIEVLLDIEAFSQLDFIDVFLHIWTIVFMDPYLPFYEITGGNDLLPKAFLPYLHDNLFLKHQMTEIEQEADKVKIRGVHTQTSQPFTVSGDLAVVTLPFSILRFVKVKPRDSFSYYKWKAIRELHYSLATKVGLAFKSRFWEREGIYGGRTVTDLPIRFAYYPSHGIGTTGPAVVLGSYTWEDDSLPWGSLSNEQRIVQALENFAVLFGPRVYREFLTGASHSWGRDPFAGGGFTIYEPGQRKSLSPYLASPEGRVHFAGAHTSERAGWIEGAIESGIRVAHEINERFR